MVEGPVRAVLPVRARDEAPGAAVGGKGGKERGSESEGGREGLGVCRSGYMIRRKERRTKNRNSRDLQDSDGLLLARLAAAVEVGKAMRQVRGQAGDRVVRRAGTSGRLDGGSHAGEGAGAGCGHLWKGPRRVHLAAAMVAVDMGRRLP